MDRKVRCLYTYLVSFHHSQEKLIQAIVADRQLQYYIITNYMESDQSWPAVMVKWVHSRHRQTVLNKYSPVLFISEKYSCPEHWKQLRKENIVYYANSTVYTFPPPPSSSNGFKPQFPQYNKPIDPEIDYLENKIEPDPEDDIHYSFDYEGCSQVSGHDLHQFY